MAQESERRLKFIVSEGGGEGRIDTYITTQVKDLSRSRVKDLVKEGFIQVNDHPTKTSYRIKEGDHISLVVPPARAYELKPEHVAFNLIHEDSSLIVLNKPPGIVMHPAQGHSGGTLVHGLLQHCRDLSGIGGIMRPGIVHRLDKDTSGLLVVAKNDRAHHFLAGQFKAGSVKKTYHALVHGILKGGRGVIDRPIGRHPRRRKEMSVVPDGGKRAVTYWKKMEEMHGFCFLAVSPKTGRTHQIRVHLSYMGHPIVGDKVYGYKRTWRKKKDPAKGEAPAVVSRQMLHAAILGFVHPDTDGYCEFEAPIPDDMEDFLKILRSRE